MIRSFRAEMRKIWTVRSTYIIGLLLLAVPAGLIGFWIYGFKDVERAAQNANVLINALYASAGVAGIFVAFLALLSVGHEYRYNTILYGLTNVNHRTKLFVAKWFAIVWSAVLMAAVALALCGVGFYIGQHLHHVQTMVQIMPGWEVVWRILVSTVAGVTFAFIIAMLLRSQVGAIATFLVLPTTLEPLLGLLLKDNVRYLPFMALGNLTDPVSKISLSIGLYTILAYVVGFGLLSYVLFLRRDAN